MRKLITIIVLIVNHLNNCDLWAQVNGNIAYSDSFVQGVTYCPGNSQYNGWTNFRSKLDTINYKFLSVKMSGTYNVSGRICNDSFIARKLAARLKNPINGSDLTINCSGNTWVIAALGSCIAGGSCASSNENVGVSADGAASACNCYSPSYQIRPIIGNGNWGGVNTNSCPGVSQRMTLEFTYRLYPTDASISKINPPDLCFNPNQLIATVRNSGYKTLDSVRINWSLNSVLQKTYYLKSKLNSSKDTNIILKSGLNYNPYTKYLIKVWTSYPNGIADDYLSNDSFIISFSFNGSPKSPIVRDTSLCGSGIYFLKAKPAYFNDTLLWYLSKTSQQIVGVGKIFKTDYLSSGNYKYFVGAAAQLKSEFIQTSFLGGNQQAGFMLNVTAIKENSLDSIALNIGTSAGTKADIEVYYRNGSYIGYENNPSAWTLLKKQSITCKGAGNPSTLPLNFSIPIGKTYGLYIQTTNAPNFYLQYGNLASSTINDGVFQINTGIGIGLNWGSIFAGRNGNIRFYYKSPFCTGPRDSIQLTIRKKPTGAAIFKGSVFNSPNINSTGTMANPDILKTGIEFLYDIQPPTGYFNSDYNKTWKISNISILTKSGIGFSTNDTALKLPNAMGPGWLKIIPPSTFEDSLILIKINILDLVNSKCDTIIQRIAYIAPTPKTNFKFTNVCSGTPVLFSNLTTIKSGNIDYKWDFGNGDSSMAPSPVYTYPLFGIYMVKLTATSQFGIYKDTSLSISIFEIPEIKYKVISACDGDSLTFNNTTSINTGTLSYYWDLGDGKTSIAKSLKYKYVIAGSYIVSLKASSNNCSNTLSKKAYQFVKPKADFETKGSCANNDIQFINNSKIGLGEKFGSNWSFGDGEGNNDNNPVHIYLKAGLKIIRYKATSQFGCEDSITKSLLILASPEAAFSFGSLCNVKPVVFKNMSIEPINLNTAYHWTLGDGAFSTLKELEHPYGNLGTYKVILKASSDNGCSSMVEKEIVILSQPIANFEALDACIGSEVIFTNKTSGSGKINYNWKFGDGDSSKLFSPTKNYKIKVASTFNVTLTATNIGGCKDAITLPVNIKETPKCGFVYHSAGTGGYEFVFLPDALDHSFYQWSFEGGGNSNLVIPSHTFPADGKYQVRVLIRSSDGCECIDSSVSVQVNHLKVGNKLDIEKIHVFPNPNKGLLKINLSTHQTFCEVKIYNLAGQLVMKNHLDNSSEIILNIGELNNGIYFVQLANADGYSANAKFILTK